MIRKTFTAHIFIIMIRNIRFIAIMARFLFIYFFYLFFLSFFLSLFLDLNYVTRFDIVCYEIRKRRQCESMAEIRELFS